MTIGYWEARIATFSPDGVEPTSFSMTRMRGSTLAMSSTSSVVPSMLGPRASATSNGPS